MTCVDAVHLFPLTASPPRWPKRCLSLRLRKKRRLRWRLFVFSCYVRPLFCLSTHRPTCCALPYSDSRLKISSEFADDSVKKRPLRSLAESKRRWQFVAFASIVGRRCPFHSTFLPLFSFLPLRRSLSRFDIFEQRWRLRRSFPHLNRNEQRGGACCVSYRLLLFQLPSFRGYTVPEVVLRGWVIFALIHGTRQCSFRARLARLASKYGGGISN